MKKFLLFALVAMIGMPVLAQDEIGDDVTKYIANAGFDEDLTFQADGTMKEAVTPSATVVGPTSPRTTLCMPAQRAPAARAVPTDARWTP